MALKDIFSSLLGVEASSTKVLVCSLESKFASLLETDGKVYSGFYHQTTIKKLSTVKQLLDAVVQGYDIVHLFCDVSAEGAISDTGRSKIIGTSLIEKCCAADVKLLWVASENKPDGYIKGFKAGRINLVMTINRNGSKFPAFLQNLFYKISRGETMPKAWASLAPQIAGQGQRELPSCIFAAGRPDAKLRG